ncbi:hypothetical protein PoB_005458500 [Plakobranchus ocellatus]|uniref:Uncharacterized protein n=1 Tax=Plakobranchus ocellatus TaxID=259542 RepID=A0AAV4C9K5_9GAST|nr:hypothetical protein PoB_005458500 [Plakobranchus ocellatus]
MVVIVIMYRPVLETTQIYNHAAPLKTVASTKSQQKRYAEAIAFEGSSGDMTVTNTGDVIVTNTGDVAVTNTVDVVVAKSMMWQCQTQHMWQ